MCWLASSCLGYGIWSYISPGNYFEEFDKNGTITHSGYYKDYKRNGSWLFYKNGKIDHKNEYEYGKLVKSIFYSDQNGNGLEYVYASGGKVFIECEIKGDVRHGKYSRYYLNGKLKEEGQ